jgi:hypothetical protein
MCYASWLPGTWAVVRPWMSSIDQVHLQDKAADQVFPHADIVSYIQLL